MSVQQTLKGQDPYLKSSKNYTSLRTNLMWTCSGKSGRETEKERERERVWGGMHEKKDMVALYMRNTYVHGLVSVGIFLFILHNGS